MPLDLAPDEAFELKLIFLRELGAGHAAARDALEKLRSGASDEQTLRDLRNFFHKIAGTAETMDLGLLGKLASVCEAVAEAMGEGKFADTPRALRILGDGLAGAASVLEGTARPDQQEQAALPEELALAPMPGAIARVMVVDDDPFSARLIDSVLRAAGFNSSFCCEPLKAFDVIRAENPDLIVLDVAMPEMDGFRLCQRIRAHPGLQLTPVIFVARKGDLEQRVRGLQVGATDFLSKPFEPQELVARARAHLNSMAQLRELAVRDGLTRCYNNKYFKMRLEQELGRARRYQHPLTLGMLDIDHFKRINDSYGHPAGDAVLAYLASILTAAVRATDVVARYGGEEFGFLLIEAAAPEAAVITNRLRERIALHRFDLPALHGDMISVNVTVSIGLAGFVEQDTPHTLLQRADAALYEAKNAGRNRVWVAPS